MDTVTKTLLLEKYFLKVGTSTARRTKQEVKSHRVVKELCSIKSTNLLPQLVAQGIALCAIRWCDRTDRWCECCSRIVFEQYLCTKEGIDAPSCALRCRHRRGTEAEAIGHHYYKTVASAASHRPSGDTHALRYIWLYSKSCWAAILQEQESLVRCVLLEGDVMGEL